MTEQNKIAGVVLAGGMGRRMGQQDKGLVEFAGRPLVDYAICSMQAITPHVGISANRHVDRYQEWSLPVIPDVNQDFLGPLAGVYAALEYFKADVLLVMPCDSPFFGPQHLLQLFQALGADQDVVIASDGQSHHPVFMALKTHLKDNLGRYLAANGRKVQDWVRQQAWAAVEFNETANLFTNINTRQDIFELESRISAL